jgi:hypothetical protein
MLRVTSEDWRASLNSKEWIDVKVALSASNAIAGSHIVVLDPISKGASMGYRKVNLNRF